MFARRALPLRLAASSFAFGLALVGCEGSSDDGPSGSGNCVGFSSVKVDANGMVMGAGSGDDGSGTDGETSGSSSFDPSALDRATCEDLCRHNRYEGGGELAECDYDRWDGEYHVIDCAWHIGCE